MRASAHRRMCNGLNVASLAEMAMLQLGVHAKKSSASQRGRESN